MASERMYSIEEVKEIIQIEDDYKQWLSELPETKSNVVVYADLNERGASILGRMEKYTTVFESPIDFMLETLDGLSSP